MNESDSQIEGRSGASPLWLWLILAAVAGAGFLFVLTRRQSAETPQPPQVGRRVPFLQLEPLTGNSRSVALDDLPGRVTVVNYWGTWCPPCIQEFPHIVALGEKFGKHENFRLYPVSCGSGANEVLEELREDTQAFLRGAKVALPTYTDPNADSRRAMALALDLQGFAYPTTVLFDQQGVIRGFCLGFDKKELARMERTIEELLAKPATEPATPQHGPPG